MIIHQKIAEIDGLPIWVVLEGSGDPNDLHTIKGVVVDRYSFGETGQGIDKVDTSNFITLVK
jgi:hypothetical protein